MHNIPEVIHIANNDQAKNKGEHASDECAVRLLILNFSGLFIVTSNKGIYLLAEKVYSLQIRFDVEHLDLFK